VEPIAQISTSVWARTAATPMRTAPTLLARTLVLATLVGLATGWPAPMSMNALRLDVMSMRYAPTHLAPTLASAKMVILALANLATVHKPMNVRTIAVGAT